jgi:ribosomal protein L15
MHPGFFRWWKMAHASSCGSVCEHPGEHGFGHHGHRHHRGHHGHHGHHGDAHDESQWASGAEPFQGGPFGVRRPLRFLANKLGLNEVQVSDLAIILDDLKTERAQAAVNFRRSTSAFAEAISGTEFDESKVTEGGQQRVQSAEQLRDAVGQALKKIHALLDEVQRKRLAYLLRTGALVI